MSEDLDRESLNELSVLSKKKNDRKRYIKGIMTMVGGVTLELYLGTFFLWGNISNYVLSYFHELDPNSSYSFIFAVDVVLVFAIWFGYQLGAFLFQTLRWNVKIVILLGASCALSGVYMSSYTTNLPAFLCFYCIMNGLGCGCCYFVPLVCGWEYFPEKKGIVSGVILAGYGFSTFIFSLVSTALVNPNGDNPYI